MGQIQSTDADAALHITDPRTRVAQSDLADTTTFEVRDRDGNPGVVSLAAAREYMQDGLESGDNPQFASVQLGHEDDTTLSRLAAGNMGVEGKAAVTTDSANKVTIAGPTANRTLTVPDANGTLVTEAGTQTLTNKTLTSPTLTTPALGTPASGTLTNCTGLPVATGVSGLGAGVATFLATPSSANLAAAVTGETGSGALVFGTSPTIDTPSIDAPTVSGGLTMTGTTRGLVFPSLTAAERDAIGVPSPGETIWQSDDLRLERFNGTTWGPV